MIEQIWGLPDEICRLARRDYLRRIGELFQKYSPQSPVNMLEVACGTGWAGRLMASDQLHVTGVDFSEEQIHTARKKAAETGVKHCHYIRQDLNDLESIIQPGKYEGIFIHCGIHHLSKGELRDFVAKLAGLAQGSTVILVEPLYHDRRNFFGRILNYGFEAFYRAFQRLAVTRHALDENLAKATDELARESDRNGWFLSPKEMPFTRREIEELFSSRYEIFEVAPVTHYGLRLGQQLAILRNRPLAVALARRWLPLFTALDRLLISTGVLPLLCKDYLFTQIVVRRRV